MGIRIQLLKSLLRIFEPDLAFLSVFVFGLDDIQFIRVRIKKFQDRLAVDQPFALHFLGLGFQFQARVVDNIQRDLTRIHFEFDIYKGTRKRIVDGVFEAVLNK